MKLRFLFSLALGAALSAAAQGGYQDGVDNFNAGRLDVAKVILDNTINDASTNKAVAYFYLGNIDMAENNMAGAKANYEKGLAANPNYAMNYIGLGEIDLKNNNRKAAEERFKVAQNLDKKNTAVMAAVARAYWNADPVKYQKDIDKLIAKAFKDSKNSEAAVYVLEGDMIASEDPGEAAGKYEMAITQDDMKGNVNREAYVKYANTYFKVNPKFAIGKLEELNAREPNSALAQRELAEKYYDNSQFGSACIQYEKYIKNPNHFQKDEQRFAGLLYSAGRYDESVDLANKILAADPTNYFMERVILLNKAAQNEWPAAEAAGSKLFGNPDATLVANDYILYGKALSEVGKPDAAVAIFEKAIELNPDKPELLTDLSAVYEKAGQNDKAVQTYKKYLDMGSATTNDYFKMARTLFNNARTMEVGTPERKANVEEGLKYIQMAIDRVPDNVSLWYYKSMLYLTGNGDKPDAQYAQTAEKMLDILNANPDNKDKYAAYYKGAYYLLGVYYSDIDKAKAIDYYTKYLALQPDDEAVKNAIEMLQNN